MGLFFPRLFFLDEKNTIPQISMEKRKKNVAGKKIMLEGIEEGFRGWGFRCLWLIVEVWS